MAPKTKGSLVTWFKTNKRDSTPIRNIFSSKLKIGVSPFKTKKLNTWKRKRTRSSLRPLRNFCLNWARKLKKRSMSWMMLRNLLKRQINGFSTSLIKKCRFYKKRCKTNRRQIKTSLRSFWRRMSSRESWKRSISSRECELLCFPGCGHGCVMSLTFFRRCLRFTWCIISLWVIEIESSGRRMSAINNTKWHVNYLKNKGT